MKATGIVRRIDDLGRVVIPKEIRRTLRIREGDPLEIFTDRDGEVILKKYSPMTELSFFAQEYADSLHDATGHVVMIADEDEIIAVAGTSKKPYMNKRVSEHVEEVMKSEQTYISNTPNEHPPMEGMEFTGQVIAPILVDGDPAGAVILISREGRNVGSLEQKLVETAASFLGKQLED